MKFFPYLTVVNALDSIDFYDKAFGFKLIESANSDSGDVVHAEMNLGDALIMFTVEGGYGTTSKAPITYGVEASLNLYIYCDDVDALYKRASAAGCKVLKEPEDAFWGDRWTELEDINGYKWSFATKIKATS